MSRVLVVNADDFALTPGVSHGILKAHQTGIVTSSTVLINLPGAQAALREVRSAAPGLAFGVHLNLTHGPPVLAPHDVGSLVRPDGLFWGKQAYLEQDLQPDPEQVLAEWSAQIDRFLSTGHCLDHLDSHHHIAAFRTCLVEVYLRLAQKHNCGVRPFLPADLPGEELRALLPVGRVQHLQSVAQPRVQRTAPHVPDHFYASFFAAGATAEQLLALLAKLPDGVSEIMCHPGLVDEGLLTSSGYAQERARELAALTSPEVRAAVEAGDIRLAGYREAWTE